MQVMIRLSSVKPFWFSGFIFIFDACNMSLKRDVFAARSSEMLCSFMFFHLSLKNKKWEDWRVSGDGSMWTAIGYGEVDAFIIIVLFSGQEPDLTQSTEQVGNKMWKRDRISLKNRWSSYRMSLYWQCTVDVDVSLICASSWEWFINMVMSGNVILSLYLPRLTSDKLEGADVVMLIVCWSWFVF